MINSKNNFRHLYMGEMIFSADYAHYVQQRKAYKFLIKSNRTGEAVEVRKKIIKQAKAAGIVDAQNITLSQSIIGFKICRKEVR